MAHIVHCRVCKREIDIDSSRDWLMPSTGWYYHINCYHDWVKRKTERAIIVDRTADEWYTLLKDYLWKDIKLPGINWSKINSQWSNFIKTKNYTPKGIYFAVIYFYEVQGGNVEMAKGGIGIVPNIYAQSCTYWSNREMKRKGTLEDIVKQISMRTQRPVKSIANMPRPSRNRAKYDLGEVE